MWGCGSKDIMMMDLASEQVSFIPLESPQTAQVSLTPLASMRTRMEIAPQTAQASFTPLESLRQPRLVSLPLRLCALEWRLPLRQPRPVLLPLHLRALEWRLPLRAAQASLTPLASMRTRMEIAPKIAQASPFIPSHNNVLLPTNLFQSIQCSSNTDTKYEPYLNAAEGTSDTLDIQCSIDEISHKQIDDDEVLLTKAAKLLYKIIGKHSELTRFDYLRSKFRKHEYETLTAKLQICILSCKYTTKRCHKSNGKRLHREKRLAARYF